MSNKYNNKIEPSAKDLAEAGTSDGKTLDQNVALASNNNNNDRGGTSAVYLGPERSRKWKNMK